MSECDHPLGDRVDRIGHFGVVATDEECSADSGDPVAEVEPLHDADGLLECSDIRDRGGVQQLRCSP